MPRDSGWKERIRQRIESWIRRELEAILGDPDPSVIVHVVTSVFISTFEKKQNVPHGQLGEDVVASLRPFLDEQTNMFWHELRFVNYIRSFMEAAAICDLESYAVCKKVEYHVCVFMGRRKTLIDYLAFSDADSQIRI